MVIHYTHTEDYIKNLYEKLGITKPQELKFQMIAELLGIHVFYWSDASQALFTGNKAFILLNEILSPQQQWQEFCHDLTHVLLHTGRQRKLPNLFVEYQEHKANRFMYHAAVPTFMLDDLNIYDCTIQDIRLVQQLFQVEEDFARKRLNQYIQNKHSILNWNSNYSKL